MWYGGGPRKFPPRLLPTDCGVRLVCDALTKSQVREHEKRLIKTIATQIKASAKWIRENDVRSWERARRHLGTWEWTYEEAVSDDIKNDARYQKYKLEGGEYDEGFGYFVFVPPPRGPPREPDKADFDDLNKYPHMACYLTEGKVCYDEDENGGGCECRLALGGGDLGFTKPEDVDSEYEYE